MVGSDTFQLNSFDVLGPAPCDDFRFAWHRGDIVVVIMVVAYCDNVGSNFDRCVAEPAALGIRVSDNLCSTIRANQERSMSQPFHLHGAPPCTSFEIHI